MSAVVSGRGLAVPGALAAVDVDIAAGEVVFITGRSGSGKTTLLRCLAALEARAEGELEYRGESVRGGAVPAFRRQVMYVPQFPPSTAWTTEEQWRFPFTLKHAAGTFEIDRARALANELGLPGDVLERAVGELSGGERQRVAVIGALLCDPEIVLLDEPTSALDRETRDQLCDVLARWRGDGHSLVVVSHDADVSARLSTRTVELEAPA